MVNKSCRKFLKLYSTLAVSYDADGCYNPQEYMAVVNEGNRFQHYSDFIGYCMLIFGAFGIIGNSLSIIVLIKKEKICFNYLLVALNCFDTFHIVFAILDVIRNNHEEAYPDTLLSIFPYFHYPLYRWVNTSWIVIQCSLFQTQSLRFYLPHCSDNL